MLDELRHERALLEATKARKGRLTYAHVRDALPEWIVRDVSPAVIATIANKLNAALDEAAAGIEPMRVDHQAKAAGDA